MAAAAVATGPSSLNRRSSFFAFQTAIEDRRSFKDLSVRSCKLERGLFTSSSAASIASLLLNKQQEALESRLRHQRCTSHRFIHLLRFSAYCTSRSSLICAALFKTVLDAKLSILRIQIILNSPRCPSQTRDLLLLLGALHKLVSPDSIDRVHHANLLLTELEADLAVYLDRAGVRALSGLNAFRRRAKHAFSLCTRSPKSLASSTLLGCCRSTAQERDLDASDHLELLDASFGTPKDKFILADPSAELADDLLGTPGDEIDDRGSASDILSSDTRRRNASVIRSSSYPSSQRSEISSLYKLHQKLHQIQANIYAVTVSLNTLMPMLSGFHNQAVEQGGFMDILRDHPLMFDGISEQIAVCHARLSKHLEDVKEQLLICFCYINQARDVTYDA